MMCRAKHRFLGCKDSVMVYDCKTVSIQSKDKHTGSAGGVFTITGIPGLPTLYVLWYFRDKGPWKISLTHTENDNIIWAIPSRSEELLPERGIPKLEEQAHQILLVQSRTKYDAVPDLGLEADQFLACGTTYYRTRVTREDFLGQKYYEIVLDSVGDEVDQHAIETSTASREALYAFLEEA